MVQTNGYFGITKGEAIFASPKIHSSEEDEARIQKYKLAADRISDASPYADAIPDCRLVEINEVAEIHPAISSDQFCDMFIRFIEPHGWFFGGGFKDITGEK